MEDGCRFDNNFTFGGEPETGIGVGGRLFPDDFPRIDRYLSRVKVNLCGKGEEAALGRHVLVPLKPTSQPLLLRLCRVKMLSVEVTCIAFPDNSPIDIQGNALFVL